MAAPRKFESSLIFGIFFCIIFVDAHKTLWENKHLTDNYPDSSAEHDGKPVVKRFKVNKSKSTWTELYDAVYDILTESKLNHGHERVKNGELSHENLVTNDKNAVLDKPETTESESLNIVRKNRVAANNLRHDNKAKEGKSPVSDSSTPKFLPGQQAPPFTLPTMRGPLVYPGTVINRSTPVIFHSFNANSGFLDCFWNCTDSLDVTFLQQSPENTHFVFISSSSSAYRDVHWMKVRLLQVVPPNSTWSVVQRLHFVTLPLYELGNWLPQIFWEWSCPDHNCGLDQVVIESPAIYENLRHPLVLKRLDARYDWLPSATSTFQGKVSPLMFVDDSSKGCAPPMTTIPTGTVAMMQEGGCSYFRKVYNLEKAGASAVLVLRTSSPVVQDMNCAQTECNTPLSIPASMIDSSDKLPHNLQNATVRYQSTPSENFFFAMDHEGKLAEMGWFLFPSFKFLMWQAQWFGYRKNLTDHLAKETDVLEIPVFNQTLMQGSRGAVSNVTLPDMEVLRRYSRFELVTSLTCPEGGLDQDCPHWDHTIQLYVCCNLTSPLCGMELGRWISPFRRRIGQWVTPVSSLLPLLTSQMCTFTMKSVPWAMGWSPSLKLRFSDIRAETETYIYPAKIGPLYHPQFTFDKHYNQNFQQMSFLIPESTKKLTLTSVITGHGSDENGCGEFCVTSHHFVFNGYSFNKTFDIAGSPLGCADQVLSGVEPNEHGTWLYGRDGWCDGQEVHPWVIDLTAKVKVAANNTVTYYGWFNGGDPDPQQSPGVMIFYSYLTAYEQHLGIE